MASEHVITVSASSFEADVINSDVPVVVDFWATWCGPCKRIAPMLEAAANDYDGQVRIAKIDVDQNRTLAGKYGIQSIPTLLVFKNGQQTGKHIGMLNRAKLDALISND
jgi:thioredoxin 1